MNLDDQLRSALRRKEPSEDFTRRVLAAVPRRKTRPWLGRVAALAAAAAVVLGTGLEYRHVREGRRAKERVMVALRIASGELRSARQKVERLSQPPVRENR